MSYETIQFSIAPDVVALGVIGICFAAKNLMNSATPELDALLDERGSAALAASASIAIDTDPILAEFRRLHRDVGAVSAKLVASPQALLRTVRRAGRLPRINPLVDLYNLISLETRLSIGAHDLERVQGNISLRLTNGSEHFLPLGASEPQMVPQGEYCYIDDANDILCRLEVRQGDKSKLTANTREAFFMIQGNRATELACLQDASDRLVDLVQRFCGGEVRPLCSV